MRVALSDDQLPDRLRALVAEKANAEEPWTFRSIKGEYVRRFGAVGARDVEFRSVCRSTPGWGDKPQTVEAPNVLARIQAIMSEAPPDGSRWTRDTVRDAYAKLHSQDVSEREFKREFTKARAEPDAKRGDEQEAAARIQAILRADAPDGGEWARSSVWAAYRRLHGTNTSWYSFKKLYSQCLAQRASKGRAAKPNAKAGKKTVNHAVTDRPPKEP